MVRGQVNMVEEAKVQSSMNSTIGALICSMQFRFVLEKQALYEHWPMQLWVLQPFGARVMDLLSTLLRCHGLIRIHWSCSRPDKQQTTQLWLWSSYGTSLALESTLDSPQSNHWAGLQQLSYLIHFSVTHHSLIKKWFIIVGKKKRCTNSKHFSKKMFNQLMRNPFTKFFCLSNLLQMSNDHEWSTLTSLAASPTVERGSASMTAFCGSLSTSDGQPHYSSTSGFLIPLQTILNHHCSLWAKCSVEIVSAAIDPFYT